MPSKAELKRAIDDARKAKNSADKAIKKLVDVHVPKNAKKARGSLLDKLRSILHRMEERIPVLRKRLEAKRKSGGDKAIKAARGEIGQREQPIGSNWGGHVTDYITFTGYTSPVYWCGCFACWCVVKQGGAKIPARIRMGYGPYIIADAKACGKLTDDRPPVLDVEAEIEAAEAVIRGVYELHKDMAPHHFTIADEVPA